MDEGHIPLLFGGIAATVAAVWILANRPRTKSRTNREIHKTLLLSNAKK